MSKRVSKWTTVAEQPDLPLLLEVRLGSLYHSFMGDLPAALISAMDDGRSFEENLERTQELMQGLSNQGFETMWIEGVWRTSSSDSGDACVPDHCVWVVGSIGEAAAFVEALVGCARRFGQKGFLLKPESTLASPSTSSFSQLYVLNMDGELLARIERATLSSLVDVYRDIRRRADVLQRIEFENVHPSSPQMDMTAP